MTRPHHFYDGHRGTITVLCTFWSTLAYSFGGSANASHSLDQDTCIFYQNSLHLKSEPDPAFANLHALLQVNKYSQLLDSRRQVAEGIKWGRSAPHAAASVANIVLRYNKPNKSGESDTVNITRDANETVVVNVTDEDSDTSGTANVTSNTTEVKIKHKLVKSDGEKHVVDSDVDTASSKGNETVSDSKGEEVNETKDDLEGDEAKGGDNNPEKPFAKENITIHKHILNITRRVNATHNSTQNVTIKEVIKTVDLSSPFHIASIYMVLFVPIGVAWALFLQNGMPPHQYVWLLPVTMCSMSVGQDLVNQSLTLILEAPNAISAIQGFSMCLAACTWICVFDLSALQRIDWFRYQCWCSVALCFAIYQIFNHLVYATCSLSERTVITNLAPLASLVLERVLMPEALKPSVTFRSKIALSLMALGAVLFSIQSPTFTRKGVCVALLLLFMTVPYRLAQRSFLADGREQPLPLSSLAAMDGFVLGVPSVIISIVRNVHFWSVVETSTEIPVFVMLVMSIATFVGLHICGLAMLRMSSATTYLVFSNIASLVTIALGIFFFGDRALATTLACIGLFANVGSGIWYSAEAHALEGEESPEDPTKLKISGK